MLNCLTLHSGGSKILVGGCMVLKRAGVEKTMWEGIFERVCEG